MIEDETSFSEFWEKDKTLKEVRCAACGGIPVLVRGYDEMDKWWYIKCQCGIEINMDAYPYGTSPYDVWKRLNSDKMKPFNEPKYVGKAERCCTCLMMTRCVEYRNMNDEQRKTHCCSEYQSNDICGK